MVFDATGLGTATALALATNGTFGEFPSPRFAVFAPDDGSKV